MILAETASITEDAGQRPRFHVLWGVGHVPFLIVGCRPSIISPIAGCHPLLLRPWPRWAMREVERCTIRTI